jgi:cyclophilin family peptidyl-prolyl cis-trans isomerase
MPKQPQSSNQTLIIIAVTAVLAIGIGFMVLGKKTDPAVDDLNLDSISTEISNNEIDVNPPDPLADDTQPSQPNDSPPINNQQETPPTMNKTNMPEPSMIIDQNQPYFATLNTNLGVIKVELFASETPKTVNNFVYLAQNNFYDDLIFHRVIPDFMIQGGCPLGTGTGSPGYKFEDEQNSAPLVEGSLAMANSGPNTNGSQFFIVTAEATPWLDGLHTNFGKVVEGLDVVKAIEKTPTGANDKPVQDIVIQSVVISND